MSVKRLCSEEYRTTTICIDSYENAILSGRIYNSYLKTGKRFQSGTQFLLEMEQMLNRMNFPAAYSATRTFSAPPEYEAGLPSALPPDGMIATFFIRILFRQNASWQGSVSWLEGRQEQSFRSVLELLLLMDSALRAKEKAS